MISLYPLTLIPSLNVGSAIALWVVVTTYPLLHILPDRTFSIPLQTLSLLLFNNLNIFIALCEICLGRHILLIQEDYKKLRTTYKGNEWRACIQFLTLPLTLTQLFDGKTWSKMWSTYALYDPSYQNHESFGFFIDFGNGLTTIPPSILINLAIVSPTSFSPLMVGCVGLAMYWQIMYGAIIYLLSFLFNKRYKEKSLTEVCLFVGVSNSLWIIFPLIGIYSCVCILRDGAFDIFQDSN